MYSTVVYELSYFEGDTISKKMLWTKYENSDVLKFIFECFLWNFSILLDFCLKVVFSIPQIPYIII